MRAIERRIRRLEAGVKADRGVLICVWMTNRPMPNAWPDAEIRVIIRRNPRPSDPLSVNVAIKC